MEDPIIDEGILVRRIARTLKESRSFPALTQNWKAFSFNLDIDDVNIYDLERRLNIGFIQLHDIPYEVLKIWRAEKGNTATFKWLHDALNKCGLHDIADLLEQKLYEPEKFTKFEWQGRLYTLKELLGAEQSKITYQKIKNELEMRCYAEKVKLTKEDVTPPETPKYYIPRTFSFRTELDVNVFKKSSQIFLVKGASKHELARATGFQPVDISSSQLHCVTVKFIVLECDNDFERICRKTTKPVHVIQFQNKRFFWIKSSQCVDVINECIKNNTDQVLEVSEMIAKLIHAQQFFSVCISDSPGMGKTIELANLAKKVQKAIPNRLVFFIVLQEFVKKLNHVNSGLTAIEAIAIYISHNKMSKIILEAMMRSTAHPFYLFLDGYDEILPEMLELADSFLSYLQTIQNVRVIVTTRPHMKKHLQKIFNQLTYEFLPFNISNQIDFLTSYWINVNGANEGQLLTQFSQECLLALKVNLTDKEKDIAGIPLQCAMLANVYSEYAVRYSKVKLEFSVNFNIYSFFDMYKKLVDSKFDRVSKLANAKCKSETKDKYFSAHVYYAIALLFPDWIDKFNFILTKPDEVDECVLYSVGLVERSNNSTAPRFIHRTFAEYFIAEFIAKNLKQEPCIELLFEGVLGLKGVSPTWEDKFISPEYKFKHFVITYFLEMHLKQQSIDRFLPEQLPCMSNINSEDLCVAIVACCCADLENCFDVCVKAVHSVYTKLNMTTKYKYFKYLPYFAVENSDKFSIVEKALDFSNVEFGMDLGFYRISSERYFQYSTPIHLAVWRGKYNIVTYLLGRYGNQVRNLDNLLHACVYRSAENSESVIEDKLLIIEVLLNKNPEWLHQKRLPYQFTPLLELDVHLKLLQFLVINGADINVCSRLYGTVLHQSYIPKTSNELAIWALSSGFKLVNQPNRDGLTPLMFHEIHDDDIPKLFYEAGADFNFQDVDGDSVLIRVLKSKSCVNAVKKILDFGANVNHKNVKGESAAHIILERYEEPETVIGLLKLIKSRGFKQMRSINFRGEKPSDLAKLYFGDCRKIHALCRNKASRCYIL